VAGFVRWLSLTRTGKSALKKTRIVADAGFFVPMNTERTDV
jgi:hypothetical protein